MTADATACPCCARESATLTTTCWFERERPPGVSMTTMDEAEWDRTRWLRRDLVRAVGLARWYALGVEQCDAAVRDAEARGVEDVAQEVMGR